MKRTEVLELMTLAQALIPSYRLPDGATLDFEVDVWHRQLSDLAADLVIAVLEAAAASEDREFVLNAAQLRNRCTAHLAGRAPSVDEAWAEVKQQIRSVGWCGTPTFTHPAIAAVVASITWQALCESTNEVADRAHFARFYDKRVADDRAVVAIPPAARLVLEQHAPPALDTGRRYELAPAAVVDQADDEPTIDTTDARRLLRAEITALRAQHAADLDDRTAPARGITKWQEGDPIDLDTRGVTPAEPVSPGHDEQAVSV